MVQWTTIRNSTTAKVLDQAGPKKSFHGYGYGYQALVLSGLVREKGFVHAKGQASCQYREVDGKPI